MAFGEGTSQLEKPGLFFQEKSFFRSHCYHCLQTFFCSLAFSRDHDDRLSSVIVKASIWWHDKIPRCSPACSWWFPFWLIIINLSSSEYEKIWVSTANLRRGAYSLGSWASMATGWSRNCCCGDVTPMFMANCPALLHEYARIAERR